MKNVLLLLFNTITFSGALYLNFLFGSGAGGRKSVGAVSSQFDTLITPAGYAFSIWGLIYLLLIGFLLNQWKGFFTGNIKESLQPTSIWFAASNIFNGLWIILWTQEMLVSSVVAIIGLLVSITVWNSQLNLNNKERSYSVLIDLPVSVYLGWIIIATVVNISVWFYANQLLMEYEMIVTAVILIVAVGILLWLLKEKQLFAPSFIGVWALIAIAFKNQGNSNYLRILIILLVLILFISTFLMIKNKKHHLN
ncbi:hypothetical protein [Cecembia sp.]|uniref:hypothetical protein n=1 Tax=Cecembia sp. TaxID=1898110 RepID=UPI0025C5F595|nr:hypothetical protein [Cecembia sp.]